MATNQRTKVLIADTNAPLEWRYRSARDLPRKWIPPPAKSMPIPSSQYTSQYNDPGYNSYLVSHAVVNRPLAETVMKDMCGVAENMNNVESNITNVKDSIDKQFEEVSNSLQRLQEEHMKVDKLEDLYMSTKKCVANFQGSIEKHEQNRQQRKAQKQRTNRKCVMLDDGVIDSVMTLFTNALKIDKPDEVADEVEECPEETRPKVPGPEETQSALKALTESMQRNQDMLFNALKQKMFPTYSVPNQRLYVDDPDDLQSKLFDVFNYARKTLGGGSDYENSYDKYDIFNEQTKAKSFYKPTPNILIDPEANINKAVRSLYNTIVEKDAKIEALKAHCTKLHQFTKQMMKENDLFMKFMEDIGSARDEVTKFKDVFNSDKERMKAQLREKTDEVERLLKMLQDYNKDSRKQYSLEKTGEQLKDSSLPPTPTSNATYKLKSADNILDVRTTSEESGEYLLVDAEPPPSSYLSRKRNSENLPLEIAESFLKTAEEKSKKY